MSKGRHAREEKRFVDERKQAVGGLDFCGQVCHSFTDNSIMHDIEFATMQPRRLCNTLAGYCAQRADGLIQLQHAGGKRHFISSVGRTHSLLLSIDHIFDSNFLVKLNGLNIQSNVTFHLNPHVLNKIKWFRINHVLKICIPRLL